VWTTASLRTAFDTWAESDDDQLVVFYARTRALHDEAGFDTLRGVTDALRATA
jgi:hypothetical protein